MDNASLRLKPALAAFVDQQVRSGAYADRDAVVADAVERLKADLDADEAKLERLRTMIADADARFARGEGQVVDDLDAYFDQIVKEATGA